MNDLAIIKNKIFTIRDKQVMLDRDLAIFYDVETKVLNQTVKRNLNRFPKEFMFQLNDIERNELVTNCDRLNSLKHSSVLPYVFTEQGVAMLAGILRSEKAIKISIEIINAFVSMRSFFIENKEILTRLTNLENNHLKYDKNFSKIFNLLGNANLKVEKGIFYDGQLFDSYKFISDLIREAKNSIKLIDNYVDDRTLNLFNKRRKNVKVVIYTKGISKVLKEDLKKYNSQYELIEIKEFNLSHDRFLIIDDIVYHIGASLKDIGLKWFGFSKMDEESFNLIKKLEEIN